MSIWKQIDVKGSVFKWEAVFTGPGGKTAGRVIVDNRYGDGMVRFMQGVFRAAGTTVVMLTAYNKAGERYPVRIPFAADLMGNPSTSSRHSLMDSMATLFNRFCNSGHWEPVFEDLSGRNRLTVSFSSVGDQPQPPETSAVISPGAKNAKPKFRKSFLEGLQT